MGTLAGVNERVGPVGETLAERFTVPVKPAMLAKLTVEFAEEPGEIARPLGFAEIEKSGGAGCKTLRVAATEWESRPL